VLKALAHYGFYIEDTGNSTTSFRWEGKLSTNPSEHPNRLRRSAKNKAWKNPEASTSLT